MGRFLRGLAATGGLVGEDGAGAGDAGEPDAAGALGEPELDRNVVSGEERELLARLLRVMGGHGLRHVTTLNDG